MGWNHQQTCPSLFKNGSLFWGHCQFSGGNRVTFPLVPLAVGDMNYVCRWPQPFPGLAKLTATAKANIFTWQKGRVLGRLVAKEGTSPYFREIQVGEILFHLARYIYTSVVSTQNMFLLFIPKIGEMIPNFFEHIFSDGWFNHQFEFLCHWLLDCCWMLCSW